MAIALTAWLMAPAPMAWTSTLPLLRITPAMAPATATGLEVAETLSTSTGARSADIAGTPSNMFTVDSLDRCGLSGRGVNGNQYGIESHGPGGHDEPVGHAGQEPLDDHVFVHADAAVPGPDHAHVRDVCGPARQDARVRGRDVGVRPDDGAGAAVEVPAHRRLFGGRLRVHVAEDDPRVGVGLEDRVSGPERIVERVEKYAPNQVHAKHLVPVRLGDAPPLPRRARRVVGRSQHAV